LPFWHSIDPLFGNGLCVGAVGRSPAGPLPVGAAGADFEAGVRALRDQNYTAALHEFQSLAAAGVANAEFMVGVMYENGYGAEANSEVAANWYRRAAERGLASAQYNLSVFYQLGKGVAFNLSEAVKLSRLAADKGHVAAQTNLGVYYLVGEGIDRDLVEARKWLSIASRTLDGVALNTVRTNLVQVEKQLNAADLADEKRRAEVWQPVK
jgi:TPR repeat protein